MGSSAYSEAESQSLANKIIGIAEKRKDALAFISPYRASQITDSGAGAQVTISSETVTSNLINFYSTVASSSYAILDTGYKYMYDRFADKFRYVPLNGDIAGCCCRTDQVAFPWFSPAGTTRGAILNGARLAYNPTQSQRDRLYSARINPVIFSNDVGGMYYSVTRLLYPLLPRSTVSTFAACSSTSKKPSPLLHKTSYLNSTMK